MDNRWPRYSFIFAYSWEEPATRINSAASITDSNFGGYILVLYAQHPIVPSKASNWGMGMVEMEGEDSKVVENVSAASNLRTFVRLMCYSVSNYFKHQEVARMSEREGGKERMLGRSLTILLKGLCFAPIR